jgi:hypothetical protein
LHYDNRELNENEYRIANIELSPNEFVDHNNYMEFGPFGADVKEYEFLSIEQSTQGKITYKSMNWCESNDKVTETNIYSIDPWEDENDIHHYIVSENSLKRRGIPLRFKEYPIL